MDSKETTLKKNGSFNNNYKNVSAAIFNSSPFFDKRDAVQVKYEMIRAASKREDSITEIADEYGFSRKSFYLLNDAFETGGLYALVPKKTGPKGASKLNQDVLNFIEAYINGHKDAKSTEISTALKIGKGVRIHPRTIYRYLKKN